MEGREQRVSRFRDALAGHDASGVFALGEQATPVDPAAPDTSAETDAAVASATFEAAEHAVDGQAAADR